MDWSEFVRGGSNIAFVSTATTGVQDHDSLLAVSVHRQTGQSQLEHELLVREVPREELLKGSEYHMVQEPFMRLNAVTDSSFRERLQELLGGCLVFTYNPPFQLRFMSDWVSTMMFDLPLLVKAVESRYAVDPRMQGSPGKVLRWAESKVGKPATWRKVLQMHDITLPGPPVLPCEANSMCLYWLWSRVMGIPVPLQES